MSHTVSSGETYDVSSGQTDTGDVVLGDGLAERVGFEMTVRFPP
jgi:hypothetical protein